MKIRSFGLRSWQQQRAKMGKQFMSFRYVRPLAIRAAVLAAAAAMAVPLRADTVGYVTQDGCALYELNLNSGSAAFIGEIGFRYVKSLAIDPLTGRLFGVDEGTQILV